MNFDNSQKIENKNLAPIGPLKNDAASMADTTTVPFSICRGDISLPQQIFGLNNF